MSAIFFSELRGQERAKRLFSRTLNSGRISHSFLFRGPDGVGKVLAARALAARINCHKAKNGSLDACGGCISCNKYRTYSHPDFQILAPLRGTITIDRIRELRHVLEYPPFEAKFRVTIIENVYNMRQEAANALLKTLEEPLPDNILILTTAESQTVLPTLISRCQQIRFGMLSFADTATILINNGLSEDESKLLALLSGGSPGEALALYQHKIIPLWQEVVSFLMNLNKCGDRNLIELLELASAMAELKKEATFVFELLQRWLRDMLLMDRKALSLYLETDIIDENKWNRAMIFLRQNALDTAIEQIDKNCNPLLVCETLLFALHRE